MADRATHVDDRLFELRARWLFEDHPWTARALRDATRHFGDNGSYELRILVEDAIGKEAGIRAMAGLHGLEPTAGGHAREPERHVEAR